jgi:hypothetical protein
MMRWMIAFACFATAAVGANPRPPVRACLDGEAAACTQLRDQLHARITFRSDGGSGIRLAVQAVELLHRPPAGLAAATDACRRGEDPACTRIGYALERLFSGDDAAVKDRAEAHAIAAALTSAP